MPSLEKGKISATQLLFLLLHNIVFPSIIFTTGTEAKQDVWITVLLGIAISLGFALLYLVLANRFPGKTLIEIDDIIWGPILGKAFSAVFILYYFYFTFLTVNITASFQKEFLLATPRLVITLASTGIAVLLATRGLEVLARCNQLIAIIGIAIWSFLFLMMLPEIKPSNFQPVLQTPWPFLLRTSLRVSALAFSTGFGFLMISPSTNDYRKLYVTTIKAFASSGMLLLMGAVSTTGILGPAAGYFVFSALTASRLINIGEVLTRMEVLMGIIFWLGGFFLTTIYIYNLFSATAELLKLKSYRTLGIPMWILLSLLGARSFANISDDIFHSMKVHIWLAVPFQYIIPSLTLMVAVIRQTMAGRK